MIEGINYNGPTNASPLVKAAVPALTLILVAFALLSIKRA